MYKKGRGWVYFSYRLLLSSKIFRKRIVDFGRIIRVRTSTKLGEIMLTWYVTRNIDIMLLYKYLRTPLYMHLLNLILDELQVFRLYKMTFEM